MPTDTVQTTGEGVAPAAERTVLFAPLGFNLAEVTRMIEVARALPPGLRPLFQVHDARFRHLVDDAGFERVDGARPLTDAEAAQAMAFDQGRSLCQPFTRALLAQRVEAERAAISGCRAAAVVHGTNPTSVISARAEGVPLAYPVPYALSEAHRRSGAPLPLLPPGRGARLDPLLTPLAWRVLGSAPILPSAFRRTARDNGVELGTAMDLLGADLTLLTSMPDEVGDGPLPRGHWRVGPIYARLGGEVPEAVRALRERPEPVVYVACGSSGSRGLVRAVLRELAGLPVSVVAPVRQFLREEDIAGAPRNIRVTDLLPAHLLGPWVDAAVVHGGQGTVQTACATGVPFAGIGLSAEQRWNVQVSERRGNAIALSRARIAHPRHGVRRALHRLLHDPAIRRAAQEVAREYAAEDGAARSAAIIADAVTGRIPT